MLTDKQIKNLKKGDRLIFVRYGECLSWQIGNVFTFSNWYESRYSFPEKLFQVQELINMGNLVHNASVYDVEIFDSSKHKRFKIMTEDELRKDESDFISKYGE
jgi:hypothetical protein